MVLPQGRGRGRVRCNPVLKGGVGWGLWGVFDPTGQVQNFSSCWCSVPLPCLLPHRLVSIGMCTGQEVATEYSSATSLRIPTPALEGGCHDGRGGVF